jgi:ABC-type transport system substrate-binding protein
MVCAAVAAIALTAGAASAQTLTIGTKLELNTLDPHFFNGFPQASSHSQIFDGLTSQNDRQQLEPALAESWRLIDDLTWEFRLRRGVVFHDGSRFTADDVIATYARLPTVPNSPALFTVFTRAIAAIDRIDDHTIRIRTSSPNRVRYSNPRVDALIVDALGEMDPEKRIAKVAAAIEAAMEDQALVPVFHPTWDYASRRTLTITPRPERRFNALMIRPAS